MGLFADILRLIFGGPTPTPTPTPPTPTPPANNIPAALLLAHNKERSVKMLVPFVPNEKLQQAAQSHADFMAKKQQMEHKNIGDGDPWTRMAATGYTMSAGAENVAWNQQNVPEVMQAWMNSSGHRAAILGSYLEYGGAVAYGPNHDPYWCSVFATPSQGMASAPELIVIDDDTTPAIMRSDNVTEDGYLIDPISYPEAD